MPVIDLRNSTTLKFINDLDEGFDTLQGVFVTLSRVLSYLLEEIRYRHGKPEKVIVTLSGSG